jgi:hypothetical protein
MEASVIFPRSMQHANLQLVTHEGKSLSIERECGNLGPHRKNVRSKSVKKIELEMKNVQLAPWSPFDQIVHFEWVLLAILSSFYFYNDLIPNSTSTNGDS